MSTVAIANNAAKVVRHRALDFLDRRYNLIHQIRREPMKAIGIVFGAGVLIGAVAGLACTGRGRHDRDSTHPMSC